MQHHTVTRLIRNYREDIEEFGKLTFDIRPLINGFEIHKPNKGGRPEKIYRLNEEQATLLITYMQNTSQVRKFKKALVKQFYLMHKELIKRQATRERAKQAREALTNAIQGLPESPHKTMKYKHYTDLVYKIVFGRNAKQLRQDFNISEKDNLRDRFQTEELEKVEKLEQQISSMIELGYEYQTIKEALTKRYLKSA